MKININILHQKIFFQERNKLVQSFLLWNTNFMQYALSADIPV